MQARFNGRLRSPGEWAKRKVIRVALADDHPIFLRGLRAVLEAQDIEIAGEATNGPDTVAMVRSLEPDVLVLDVRMPGMDGLEVLKSVKNYKPRTAVLMLTICDDATTIHSAILGGAAGYLVKGNAGGSVQGLVRRIAFGEQVLTPGTLKSILALASQEAPPKAVDLDEITPMLSEGERRVFARLLAGRSNKEIMKECRLSANTVKTHLKAVFRKLSVSDRTQALLWAVRRGWRPAQEAADEGTGAD